MLCKKAEKQMPEVPCIWDETVSFLVISLEKMRTNLLNTNEILPF